MITRDQLLESVYAYANTCVHASNPGGEETLRKSLAARDRAHDELVDLIDRALAQPALDQDEPHPEDVERLARAYHLPAELTGAERTWDETEEFIRVKRRVEARAYLREANAANRRGYAAAMAFEPSLPEPSEGDERELALIQENVAARTALPPGSIALSIAAAQRLGAAVALSLPFWDENGERGRDELRAALRELSDALASAPEPDAGARS